jgi:hypothetical protein
VEVIHIDLPLFYSPTGAFGYFSGEIEVSHLPHADEPFPWPEHWLAHHEALFKEQSKQVWGITPWEWPPAKQHITMFGIVCSNRDEARLLSQYIERVSGIAFWEHESAQHSGGA